MIPALKDEIVVQTKHEGSVTSLCKRRRLDTTFGSDGRNWRGTQWVRLLWFPVGPYCLPREHLKQLGYPDNRWGRRVAKGICMEGDQVC